MHQAGADNNEHTDIEIIRYPDLAEQGKNTDAEGNADMAITNLRGVNISIQGKDLINLGMEPGPMFKKIMDDVLEAKLNGKVKTKKDELDYAKKLSLHSDFHRNDKAAD